MPVKKTAAYQVTLFKIMFSFHMVILTGSFFSRISPTICISDILANLQDKKTLSLIDPMVG